MREVRFKTCDLKTLGLFACFATLACSGAASAPDDQGGVGGSSIQPSGGSSTAGNAGGASLGGTSTLGLGGAPAATGGNGSIVSTSGAAGATASSFGGTASGGTSASTLTGTAGAGGPSSGGSKAAGGTSASGGSKAAGGTSASGGSKAAGGTSASGGSKAAGGTAANGGAIATGGAKATGGTAGTSTVGEPQAATVRVFYLRPSDVSFEQRYPDGIGKVMVETQAFYKQQLGVTFKLNSPVVEVVVGEHVRSWYENTPNGGEKYWWSATNGQDEVQRRFSLPDRRWMGVSLISAEGDGAGGGGTGGWVLLCGHDADGDAGYPTDKARWVGGMVHEMGHAFGLPDSTSLDGTCMSASFYNWPNCTFTQSQKDQMLKGAWGTGKFLF